MIRKTVHYSGHVQGVCFRMNAAGESRGFNVTGYVKNLPDGRVQLVAEGESGEVDRFLDAVAERMSGYIHETKIDTAPATGQYTAFDIAF